MAGGIVIRSLVGNQRSIILANNQGITGTSGVLPSSGETGYKA